MRRISIRTSKQREVVDITERVASVFEKSDAKTGLVHIYLRHTTAALTIADLDPGTDLDMLDALEVMVPKLKYRHPHDPSHVPDHILSAMIGASLSVPLENGEFMLGEWQRIVLVEFAGPRERELVVSFMG